MTAPGSNLAQRLPIFAGWLLGVVLPPLFAYSRPPDPSFYNQVLAVLGFGILMVGLDVSGMLTRRWSVDPISALLLLLLAVSLASPLWTLSPWSLALQSASLLAVAFFTLQAGAALRSEYVSAATTGLALALVVASLASIVVAWIQFFAPELADNHLIAMTNGEGRAVGNMRQPNLLATLFLWGCASAVWLVESSWFRRHLPHCWQSAVVLAILLALFIMGIVLSGSRTGAVGVFLLAGWGITEEFAARKARGRVGRRSRVLLLMSPLMLLFAWWSTGWLSRMYGLSFFAETRIAQAVEGASPRLKILHDSWVLIKNDPWTGVGWGEMNHAWSLTPFPDRYGHFIGHAHNIFVQFLVELGVPLGLLAGLLLLAGAWIAVKRSVVRVHPDIPFALVLVLIAGVHSLSEFPLWYAFYLLPTAFAYGLCLPRQAPVARGGQAAERESPLQAVPFILIGLAISIGALLALRDYGRVSRLYLPDLDAPPFDTLLADAEKSKLFDTYADSSNATLRAPRPHTLESARRAAHRIIGPRLLISWARSLNAEGQTDKARYLVERLREFQSPAGDEFLRVCDTTVEPKQFQCEASVGRYTFKDFR